jgi:hypothetical protein
MRKNSGKTLISFGLQFSEILYTEQNHILNFFYQDQKTFFYLQIFFTISKIVEKSFYFDNLVHQSLYHRQITTWETNVLVSSLSPLLPSLVGGGAGFRIITSYGKPKIFVL